MSPQISQAGELAHYLVVTSNLHPAFRDNPLIWDMEMGGYPDPTTQGTAKQFEGFTVALQRAAFDRAIALVTSRLASIQAVAAELLADTCAPHSRDRARGRSFWCGLNKR